MNQSARLSIAKKSLVAVLGALGQGAAGSVTANFDNELNAAPVAAGVTAAFQGSVFTTRTGRTLVSGGMTLSKNSGTLTAGDVVTFQLTNNGTPIGPTRTVTATTAGSDVVATCAITWVDTNVAATACRYGILATITGGHTGGVLADQASITAVDL